MELDLHAGDLAVCRLPADAPVPDWASNAPGPLVSITRTGRELSIVVAQAAVPSSVSAEGGWRALAVRGPLPFHLVGILASLTAPLAEADVPIFAISTHDTDWLLVGHDRLDDARAALDAAGHRIHDPSAPGAG
ncbi:MAG: ACT domain-containing protein [Nitriliruptoraceae bacterium]